MKAQEFPFITIGFIFMLVCILGFFSIEGAYTSVYNNNASWNVTNGLLITSAAGNATQDYMQMFGTAVPSLMWLLILVIVIMMVFSVYHVTKYPRGELITKRKRL